MARQRLPPRPAALRWRALPVHLGNRAIICITWAVHIGAWVALAAACVAVSATVLLGLPLDPRPPTLVFAATLFVYSHDRVADRSTDAATAPERVAVVSRYGRAVRAAATLAFFGLGALALRWHPVAPLAVLAPPVLAWGYTERGWKRRLLAKNGLVGLAWGSIPLGVWAFHAGRGYAGATVAMAATASTGVTAAMQAAGPASLPSLPPVPVLVLCAHVALTVTVAAAVVDVRDVAGDRASGVSTLPACAGPAVTRAVGVGALLAAAVGTVAAVAAGVVPSTWLALLVHHGYVMAYAAVARPDRGALFYGGVVDGEHLALALVALAVCGG